MITVHGKLEAVNKGIGTIHPGPRRAALESLNEYHLELLGFVSNSVKMGTYCSRRKRFEIKYKWLSVVDGCLVC